MTTGNDFRLDEQTRNMLVDLVKVRPLLYTDCGDLSVAELRDERQKLWEEVGEKANIPAEVCKVKFTNLKNNYYKNLRTDSVGTEMRRRLDFLDEMAPWNRVQTDKPARITQRRSTKRVRIDYNEDSNGSILVNTASTSMPLDSAAHQAATNNGVSNGHQMNNIQNNPKNSQIPNTTVNGESNNNNIDQHQNGVNGSTTKKPTAQWTPQSHGTEIDDLSSFFNSMEKTTRKFNAHLKIKVKRMISDIIYDAEEQWLNTQT